MKSLTLLLALTFSIALSAQVTDINKKLEEYNFSEEFLTDGLEDGNSNHSFNATITTIYDNKTTVEEAMFDPTKEMGERWILKTVNGKEPTKKNNKKFDKEHNNKQPKIESKMDEDSWNIESDDSTYLVVSFRYDKTTLPKKYIYLGDCKGLAYFNKKTKLLEKAEFVNEKPLKVKYLNLTDLDMVITYKFNEEEKMYLIQKEDLRMEAELLGQYAHVNHITVYTDYKKIK